MIEENQGPTPETASKLRTDVILKMYRRGTIGQHELWAAEEIRTYWAAFMRMAFRARVLDGTQDCRAQGRPPLMPQELLTGREQEISTRYQAWVKRANAVKVGPTTALQIVIAVVVDNAGISDLVRLLGVNDRVVPRAVKQWLGDYGKS